MKKFILPGLTASFCLALLASCGGNNPAEETSGGTRQLGESCDDEHGCMSGLVCEDDLCRKICAGDSDCTGRQSCIESRCVNNISGECRTGLTGENCDKCAEGYFGADCQPCLECGHGTCSQGKDGSGNCQCDNGWTGAQCDQCASGFYGAECQGCPDCGSQGQCDQGLTGSGNCLCSTGWQGASCDSCAPLYFGEECQPCPNCGDHGNCSDGSTGEGTCECALGWGGDSCDECAADFFGPECLPCPLCGEHGHCADGPEGTGLCQCDEGWAGELCDFQLRGSGEPCEADDQCQNGLICDYQTQVCALPCGSTADCQSGFDCVAGHCQSCPAGFMGANCQECLPGRFGENCAVCTCQHGTCDEGRSGTGTCKTCENGWYWFSGSNCDSCDNSKNYYGDGSYCQLCPCQNGGVCYTTTAGQIGCNCPVYSAWYGDTCEKCPDHWITDPTTGIGCSTCATGWDIATKCKSCAAGYGGDNCEVTCKNGATYNATTGKCTCQGGWSGDTCDTCDYSVGYGAQCTLYGSFTDSRSYSGNVYKTVVINGVTWLAENLRYTGIDCQSFDWAVSGCFYNWDVAQKACPKGTHLPTEEEYLQLIKYVASAKTAKSSYLAFLARSNNYTSDTGADEFGFGMQMTGVYWSGDFSDKGDYCRMWTKSEFDEQAGRDFLSDGSEDINIDSDGKDNYYPIRCIVD